MFEGVRPMSLPRSRLAEIFGDFITPDGVRLALGYLGFLVVLFAVLSGAARVLDGLMKEPPGAHADRLSAYCVDHGIGSWERCVSLYEAGKIRDEELEGYR
ncbi:hypothetical protein BA190_27420 [Labrys sp. WJW]|nr:hypothetical protein BA190_27420 [Labrys sp. WJW]